MPTPPARLDHSLNFASLARTSHRSAVKIGLEYGHVIFAPPQGNYVIGMNSFFLKSIVTIALISCMLLVSESAWALRCGNRLVKEGMREFQVIAICGDPVETRQLGYVLRPYIVTQPAGLSGLHATRHVYSGYHLELSVTQMVFNFGPHKLMRILRFEGGQLKSIETAGYGYHERP